jgi:hypothetical protein
LERGLQDFWGGTYSAWTSLETEPRLGRLPGYTDYGVAQALEHEL